MRVALISDLHGNSHALRAVLADIGRQGADCTVCLGDTATLGARPAEVLELLHERRIPCIQGNHDAFLLEPELVDSYSQVPIIRAAIDWCRDQLPALAIEQLRSFQPSLSMQLGADTTLRLFHGSPRSHMEDILCTTPADELDQMLGSAGMSASVLAGGHTHVQMLRQHRGVLLVNPGSVGMPFREYVEHRPPTIMPFAEYALVEAEESTLQVALRRVPIDVDGLRRALAASSNPLAPMLLGQYG
jgi:predicted phosphodiesterase